MTERWYRQAVVYCVDVGTFQDSDGDGIGDLQGLISRLDYLARLGVTCLWLNPVHPSPERDGGYDVSDFYGINPRYGSLGDFADLVHRADNRGIRVLMDLVVNHTSDEHPWFVSARSDPKSPYRDWYVWSADEPSDRTQGMVFPGEQKETWTFDEQAGAWYYHRFYDFQPDLNWANAALRDEIKKVMAFWLALGVSGFRVDAAPFVVELTQPGNPSSPKALDLLTELREVVSWRRGDGVLLAEANVAPDELVAYFGDSGGGNNRFHMMFGFLLNARIMLALARSSPEPLVETLSELPPIPQHAQWATFLRNHDESDLSRLTAEQRKEVFAAFGPKPSMQLYGRGIRRRMASMLGNDRRRLELAYSLQFTLPGTPVVRYGEEIGMGEDLKLPDRDAIRTPMQWSGRANAGFSTAPKNKLRLPVVSRGEYGYRNVNVTAQKQDPSSLLSWFERMIRTLRECPEVGEGACTVVEVSSAPTVLVHRCESPAGTMLFLHNLADVPVTVDVSVQRAGEDPVHLFADKGYESGPPDLAAIGLSGYGYRWLRLRHDPPD